MPQTLRGFRDYDEKDVINLYTMSGAPFDTTYQIIATKGSLVKIMGDGFRMDNEPIEMLGNYGAFNVSNFVAQRYGVTAKVALSQPTDTQKPLGMLLFDVRELDENQIPLKYNPRKAAEMEAALSGQAAPLVTRGIFLYSGVTVSGGVAVAAGGNAYAGFNGNIATSGTNIVGKFLGNTGAATPSGMNGTDLTAVALVWLNCT